MHRDSYLPYTYADLLADWLADGDGLHTSREVRRLRGRITVAQAEAEQQAGAAASTAPAAA